MNAIDVECPECGAKPGKRCQTMTGKATPVSHGKRKRAAFEMGEKLEESGKFVAVAQKPKTEHS
jgi:hypothetical protein